MKLNDYLKKEDYTIKRFARHAGIAYAHLYAVVKGKRRAGVKTATKIKKATNNQVTYDDIFSIPLIEQEKTDKKEQ